MAGFMSGVTHSAITMTLSPPRKYAAQKFYTTATARARYNYLCAIQHDTSFLMFALPLDATQTRRNVKIKTKIFAGQEKENLSLQMHFLLSMIR